MNKINLGVVFGGMSTEHDVSIVSGTSILRNLDRNKYNLFPIYISPDGTWNTYHGGDKRYEVGDKLEDVKKIDNIFEYLKNLDAIFPVLHGLYGEDGTIQGFFEILKIPYVGCKVLGSAIAMDKVYAKVVFEKAGLKQAKYEYIREHNGKYIYIAHDFTEKTYGIDEICELMSEKLKFPMFVKPSNSGSSVGVNKSKNIEGLKKHIEHATQFDKKILIEEGISGREIECSVLGNEQVEASCIGEIEPADEFYSYDAKYKNADSKLTIPANLPKEISDKVREIAIKAFKAIDGKGYARVDFFVDDVNNIVYLNEINTIPGFTEISMYPKLWESSGLKYENLLDRLIELALNGD